MTLIDYSHYDSDYPNSPRQETRFIDPAILWPEEASYHTRAPHFQNLEPPEAPYVIFFLFGSR